MALNLKTGQRAQRKTLITVAEWVTDADTYAPLTKEPSTWATDYATYYELDGGEFKAISGSTAPTFKANYYFEKVLKGTTVREIMGTRTEDSSIEFNADIQTSTDILGITYTDVNKTEPQQSFDPMYILGGSLLSDYLVRNALDNNIDAYNNIFNVYIITAFIGAPAEYFTVCHSGCSIIPTSMGGDSYNSMPVELHYSNNITKGKVDKLSKDFVFTAE